jgi:aminoglycoside phosphotransferase (APT) family kinase protein
MGEQDAHEAGSAPAAADTARPEASRRDPERTRVDLEAWLSGVLPAGADPEVRAVHVPATNGMSSETVLVDASWNVAGTRVEHPLVARIAPDPATVPVFPDYDLATQFRTMRKVAELTAVPVPRVHWLEEDPGAIGAPFFVMDRAQGVVPPDVMPYPFGDNWLFDASVEDQQRLESASIDVLVALHAIESPEDHFGFLVRGDTSTSPLRRHVDELRAYYEWVAADGVRVPLIERCFEHLDAAWPEQETPAVLSWGDARIGNVIYDDFEPVAVLDWEMAAIAPREVDLAWMIYMHRFFQDVAAVFDLDGMPEFLRRDRVEELYAARSGHIPQDMDVHLLYAALRYAVVAVQVKKRSIAFGQDELPEDPDDMPMNRQGLEEMLAGTYWERVLGSG